MSTDTWHERRALAEPFEDHVIGLLRDSGWDAERFGQGQLSETMRLHLRQIKPPTAVRWLPDIIAGRTTALRTSTIRYVDAKAGETWRKTGNHAVEVSPVNADDEWQLYSGTEVFYVFTDGGVATPERVRATGWKCCGVGPHRTDFWLFPRVACKPFEAVFGIAWRATA